MDSGLLPRLQRKADVKYLRHDAKIGLLATLDEALGGQFRSAVIHQGTGQTVLVSDIQHQLEELEKLKQTFDQNEQTAINQLIEQLQNKLNQQDLEEHGLSYPLELRLTTPKMGDWELKGMIHGTEIPSPIDVEIE